MSGEPSFFEFCRDICAPAKLHPWQEKMVMDWHNKLPTRTLPRHECIQKPSNLGGRTADFIIIDDPIPPRCACRSEKYGHCPEKPTWAVNLNDEEMYLCERCHQNVVNGAYPQLKLLAAVRLPDFFSK